MPVLLPQRCLALAAAMLLLPHVAPAQTSTSPGRWLVEAQAGGFWQDQWTDDDDVLSDAPGLAGSVRVAASLAPRLRLVASGSAGRLGDAWREVARWPDGTVSTAYRRFDVRMLTAGVELDARQGRTSVALGLEAGPAWVRYPVLRREGPQPFDYYQGTGPFRWEKFSLAVVPSVTVRRAVATRLDLSLAARAPVGTHFGGIRSPLVLAGVAWRPH